MTQPIRIQRKRTKGYDMQAVSRAINGLECVYVGRPTSWGNPFRIDGWYFMGDPHKNIVGWQHMTWCEAANGYQDDRFTLIKTNEQAVEWFMRSTKLWSSGLKDRCAKELRGNNLACWCGLNQPCHADVLLELANR